MQEFTYTMKIDKTDPLDILLKFLKKSHKSIKPRTLDIIASGKKS